MVCAVLVAGCAGDATKNPPQGLIHFPVAATATPESPPAHLLVANSNFDLRYRAGSLQSYDLATLNAAIDAQCADLEPDKCAIVPTELDPSEYEDGTATVIPTAGLLAGEVRIGSFADGMALSTDGSRAYLATRSDASLGFVEIDAAGALACGGDPGTVHRCTDDFREVDTTYADAHDISLPSDPVDLYVGSLESFGQPANSGDYIIMAHRNGATSLMIDRADEGAPQLIDAVSGLADELVTISVNPASGIAWIPSARTRTMSRVGVAIDERDTDSFLFSARPLELRGLDTGADTRQVRFDPRPDVNRAYLASRSPEALLIVDTSDPEGSLPLIASVPVGNGTSRLELAELTTTSGPTMFAFVTCFNSRQVHVIDVDLGLPVTVVNAVSGAFELVIDADRARMYVVDFRTSVIRVYDLTPALDCHSMGVPEQCAPNLLGLLGRPSAVEELR